MIMMIFAGLTLPQARARAACGSWDPQIKRCAKADAKLVANKRKFGRHLKHNQLTLELARLVPVTAQIRTGSGRMRLVFDSADGQRPGSYSASHRTQASRAAVGLLRSCE
jgi:hypothetical protein